jgi:hypothetical protein
MRIIEVTSEQFNFIWLRLLPSQRSSGDIPTPAIVMPWIDTLIVLQGKIQYGSLADADLAGMNMSTEIPAKIEELFTKAA